MFILDTAPDIHKHIVEPDRFSRYIQASIAWSNFPGKYLNRFTSISMLGLEIIYNSASGHLKAEVVGNEVLLHSKHTRVYRCCLYVHYLVMIICFTVYYKTHVMVLATQAGESCCNAINKFSITWWSGSCSCRSIAEVVLADWWFQTANCITIYSVENWK